MPSAAWWVGCAVAAWLALALPQASFAQSGTGERPDLAQARALLDKGEAKKAYEMLLPFEERLAGDKDFDYAFGIAALDAGQPDQAVIALERVVLVDPLFAGAKLDLARAYFAVRNYDDAEREFKNVLELNPPAQAKAVVERYMAAIADARAAKRTQVTGYVEATLGTDDNVNNSTASSLVALPVFGGAQFTLSPTNVQTGDTFLGPAAGLSVRHTFAQAWTAFGGADFRGRFHKTDKVFDQENIDYVLGVERGDAEDVFRLAWAAGRAQLNDRYNRKQGGLVAEYRRVIDSSNQIALFGQSTRYHFEKSLRANDFVQNIFGLGWSRVFDAERRLIGVATAYAGREHDLHNRVDGEKRIHGLRLVVQTGMGEEIDLFATAGAQFGKYLRENVFFLRSRHDEVFDLTVGMNWRPAAGWTVRPQYAYTRNDSNVSLNEFDRNVYSVTVRRDF